MTLIIALAVGIPSGVIVIIIIIIVIACKKKKEKNVIVDENYDKHHTPTK
jgi:hypothetical protein